MVEYGPPEEQSIPPGAFAGFQTASHKALAAPSAAALARAQRLLEEDVEQEPPKKRFRSSVECTDGGATTVITSSSTSYPTTSFATASGKIVSPPSRAAMNRAHKMMDLSPATTARQRGLHSPQPFSSPSHTSPDRSSGLLTASGKCFPIPTDAARARVTAPLDTNLDLSNAINRSPDLYETPSRPSAFATASGTTALPLGKEAHARTGDLFPTASTMLPSSGFATASGKGVTVPSEAARKRAANLFSKPSHLPNAASQPAFVTPSRTSGFASASGKAAPPIGKATREAAAALFGETATIAPFRSPLQPKTPMPNAASPASRGKPISVSSIGQRRSGMGLSAPRSGKKSFISPFKRGGVPTAPSRPAPSPAPPIHHPIFDLQVAPNRTSYRDAFLKPQYMSIEDLEDLNIPSEIWQIDPRNAEYYHFETAAGDRGFKHAQSELEKCGVSPTERWVKNHWSLVMWKLCGVIQAQPTLIDSLWTFETVLNQLKYRHEREIGNAQRSLVKRIQEHDSSPSLSMVLCVVAIHRPPPQKNDKNEDVSVLPHLELTDGWYHILAQVDDCLARAISKGRINVGQKLGITGAKLDSSADGAEVMDAFDKSRLVLSGNSTSLARWDVKLGMQRAPFVATLSSLSPDGGMVTMMDVTIDKIFPLAFRSIDWNKEEGEWDQAEETIRQNKWKETYEAEAQKLQDKMQQSLQPLQDLVGLLQGDDGDVGPEPEDLEDRFESLLAQPTLSLSRVPPGAIPHLARYAIQYLENETAIQHAEMHASLQSTCPPREVRDFRIIRFTDTITEREPTRIGMLKVWDAKVLGDGLQQGKRYMVTNLVGTRQGNWTKRPGSLGEVWLQSRRDTRWQIIE